MSSFLPRFGGSALPVACACLLSASACIVPQPEVPAESSESSESSEASESSEETGAAPSCGWDNIAAWYSCGFEGQDPNGAISRACAVEYVSGEPCPTALLFGCCDAEGNLWFCQQTSSSSPTVAMQTC